MLMLPLIFTATDLLFMFILKTTMNKKIKTLGGSLFSSLTQKTKYVIVFNENTQKYRYAISKRPDIVLLKRTFVDSIYEKWLKNEDIDMELELRKELLLPFLGHNVCLSNIDHKSIDRVRIAQLVTENGGQFSETLNKKVTVLVSPIFQGNKCIHAEKWDIPIVSCNWIDDSMSAYSPLDTSSYLLDSTAKSIQVRNVNLSNTLLPPGYNNFSFSLISQKTVVSQKRKLMDTQWNNMIKSIPVPQKKKYIDGEKLWESSNVHTDPIVGSLDDLPTTIGKEAMNSGKKTIELLNDVNSFNSNSDANDSVGIFHGAVFFLYGFDAKKFSILKIVIESNSGKVSLDSSRSDVTHFLLYSLLSPTEVPDLRKISKTVFVGTEWLIERSLCKKILVVDIWGEFIFHRNISGFHGLKISISGFTGSELLHMERLITLLGATYCPVFTSDRDLLIAIPGSKKEIYAKNWDIPVVSPQSIWKTVKNGKLNYIIPKKMNRNSELKSCHENYQQNSTGSHLKSQIPMKTHSTPMGKEKDGDLPTTNIPGSDFLESRNGCARVDMSKDLKRNSLMEDAIELVAVLTSKNPEISISENEKSCDGLLKNINRNRRKQLIGRATVSTISNSDDQGNQVTSPVNRNESISFESGFGDKISSNTGTQVKYVDKEALQHHQAVIEAFGQKAEVSTLNLTQETHPAEDCLHKYMRRTRHHTA